METATPYHVVYAQKSQDRVTAALEERDLFVKRLAGANQRIAYLEQELRHVKIESQRLREALADTTAPRLVDTSSAFVGAIPEALGLPMRDLVHDKYLQNIVLHVLKILRERFPPTQARRLRKNATDRLRRAQRRR